MHMLAWIIGIVGGLIAGAIIGFIARAIVPGKQDLSIGWTAGLGIAGMWIGQIVGRIIPPDNEGVPWILGTISAVGLLFGLIKTGYINRFTNS